MIQTETSEISTECEQHCMPLKRRFDGRSYKALYKAQRIKIGVPDRDEELRRSAAIQRIAQISNVDNAATILGDKNDLGEELCCSVAEELRKDPHEGVCEGAFLESHSVLNESSAHPLTKNVEDIAPIGLENGSTVNSSNEGNIQGLKMETSESVTPSTSSTTENPDFVTNCFLCSRKRRLVFDSPDEDLCSCTNTPKGNLSDLSCQKSSKGSFIKLQKLPVRGTITAGDSLLNNVNSLREFWHKNQNAVVVDEFERMLNMIFFILSLPDVHKPFLVTGTSATLALWEAEFIRLKPSVNVVVYHTAKGTKNNIRSIEFRREEGGKMLQVLLCSMDVISEDFHILKHLKCGILILDECRFSMSFDLLKMLDADMRILLFIGAPRADSGSLKDKRDEYLSVLSFLYPPGELDKVDFLKYDESDSLVKLVDSFSRFKAYESSKFVEYWVPVPLSNLQLEQYCHTLHSGSSALTYGNMKTDVVGEKVHDVLMKARKCCDHPYLADQKLVVSRISNGYSASENVDFGIKASGKLHLLCKLFSNIKSHKLRALVLFQAFDGSRESIGDMLEDLLRDRFGADMYERIDKQVNQSKKQAAVSRFGKEDSKQFVFLLENRACQPWMKLSVDVVVILSSEWTPALDIRTLERLTIKLKSRKIPIFRLYCSCTIEEKALILGRQLPSLNVKSGTTSSTLLMWGASSLFSRLEDYHVGSSDASDVNVSYEHGLLDDVVTDLMSVLSDTAIGDSQNSSIVSKALLRSGNGVYHTNCALLGERKDQLIDGEEPPVFWKKLLHGRSPRWKYSHEPTVRNRKRVMYSDELPKNSEIQQDESGKKRKKMDGTFVIANDLVEEGEIVGSEEDAVFNGATSDSIMAEPHCSSNALSSSSRKKSFSRQNSVVQPDIRSPSDAKQRLHDFLKADIEKLWKALKLSEDVLLMVLGILEHLRENNKEISKDDPHLVQAFKMSLCWIAVDMLGQNIDRKSSLLEARKILNFECPEELAYSVYKKLTVLKDKFPQLPGKTNEVISLRTIVFCLGDITLRSTSPEKRRRVKIEVEDDLLQNQEPKNYSAAAKKLKKLRKVQKKCAKHKLSLLQKHEKEIQEFNKICKEKREKLDEEYKVELAVVNAIHSQSAMKFDRLKAADNKYAMSIKDLESSREMGRKELDKKHAVEFEEEDGRCEQCLAEAEKSYGRNNTNESESDNDKRFSTTSGSTTPPTTIVSDAVDSDASANGDTGVISRGFPNENELMRIIDSTEQAANFSSQNPREFVNEIPSSNRDTEADSGLLGNHGGSLPENWPSVGDMDLADRPEFLHIESAQFNNERSDLLANITDSADGGSSDSHAAGIPGNIHDSEQSAGAQPPTPTQLDESLGELQKQPALGNGENNLLLSSDIAINTVDSRDLCDLPTASRADEPDSSRNHALPKPSAGDMDLDRIEFLDIESAQVNNGRSDLHANITDTADGGSDIRTAGEPGNIHDIEQSDRAQPPTPTQLDESLGELQKLPTLGDGENNPLLSSDTAINTVDSRDLPGIPTASRTDHAPGSELIDSSRNHALPEVAENAAELQNGGAVLPVGSNSVSSEANSCAHTDLLSAGGASQIPPSVSGVATNAVESLNQPVIQSGPAFVDLPGLATNAAESHPQPVIQSGPTFVDLPGVATNAVEPQNQPVIQSGSGPSFVYLPNLRSAPQTRPYLLAADPLQSEIDKLCKDRELANKLHDYTKSQLETERDKEILELSNQICEKYAAKKRDAEALYKVKVTEIEANRSKVFMNKLLSDVFRLKCLDFRPSRSSIVRPGVPSVPLLQQQLLLSQSSRQSPVDQPAYTHNPTVHSPHHYPGVRLPSSSQPAFFQQTFNQSSQSAHHPGIPSWPLQISNITPNIGSSRVGVGAGVAVDIRGPAPHLQPFRPSSSMSSPSYIHPLPPPQQQPVITQSPRSSASTSHIHPLPPPHQQPVITQVPRSSVSTSYIHPLPPSQQQPVITQVPRSTVIAPASHSVPLRLINQSSSNGRVFEGDGSPNRIHVLNNKAGDVSAMSSLPSDVVCLSDDDN